MAERKPIPPVQVNWGFGEETSDQVHLEIGADSPPPPIFWTRRLVLILVLCTILGGVLFQTLSLLARRAEAAEQAALYATIQQSLILESWIWQRGDLDIATLLDPNARPEWTTWMSQCRQGVRKWAATQAQRPEYELLQVEEVGSDLVLASVAVVRSEVPDDRRYREVRFYRNVNGTWLRTSPPQELWGAEEQLQTAHFTLIFTTSDQKSVGILADQLDAIYQDLLGRVGLTAELDGPGLTIQVVADSMSPNAGRFAGRTLSVISPCLGRLPDDMSDSRQMAESVLYPLTGQVLAKAVGGAGDQQLTPGWFLVLRGVQSWLAQAVNPLPPTDLPPPQAALKFYVQASGLPTLADLRVNRDPDYTWASGWASQAAHSLIAYAMSTYGPDKLDDLVAGLTQYEGWETLIPVVFGVSAEEFEAGWHTYLRTQL